MSAILGTFCCTIRRLTRLRPADGTTARRAAAATVRGCLLVCFAFLLVAVPAVFAGDWPHWRGPERNGISAETGWLEQWPESGPPIAWRAKVGLGFSSMVVADNRVCTMGHENEQDTVFCFDATTGKELWKKSYPAELGDKYFEGGTTGTPTFDTNAVATGGGRVFTLSRWGDAFCFEAATGKIVWQKNIHRETGVRFPGWGFGGAPLVHENLVILSAGDAGMALEKTTGKIVWLSANKDAGYSTPLPFRWGDAWLALISSGQAYTAVDPKTGKEAWRIRWLTQFGVNAADPIVAGDYVFISSGYNKGGGLFKLGGAEPESFWKTKALRTQMNAAVLFEGHLYGVDGDTTEQGMLKCLEFNTGKELWKAPGVGSGTVMIANGKLIVLGARGELMIAPATPAGFKPVARAQVLGGKCWTVPVLANGRVYARNSRGDLVCVDLRGRGQ